MTNTSAEQSRPGRTARGWGLRHPGMVTGKGGKNEVIRCGWRPWCRELDSSADAVWRPLLARPRRRLYELLEVASRSKGVHRDGAA